MDQRDSALSRDEECVGHSPLRRLQDTPFSYSVLVIMYCAEGPGDSASATWSGSASFVPCSSGPRRRKSLVFLSFSTSSTTPGSYGGLTVAPAYRGFLCSSWDAGTDVAQGHSTVWNDGSSGNGKERFTGCANASDTGYSRDGLRRPSVKLTSDAAMTSGPRQEG